MISDATKGGPNGRRTANASRRRPAEATSRLNNFLSREERALATATYKRRLAWYHGPDYRRTGQTGIRLNEAILALPLDVLKLIASDAYSEVKGRYSLSGWHGSQTTGYEMTFRRGTVRIVRDGKVLATLVLETEEQYAAGVATLNPTGRLDDAPPGALRILCVCSLGLATGVVLRQRTETILRKWGVDAWLEISGADAGRARAAFADVVVLTRDEAEDVAAWGHPQTLVFENWLDPREIRAALAGLPQIVARRVDVAATMAPLDR